jgi:hypothetical protein
VGIVPSATAYRIVEAKSQASPSKLALVPNQFRRRFSVKRTLLAASLVVVAIIAAPPFARSADEADVLYAQAGPMSAQGDDQGTRDGDRAGMRGWPMMRGMMMHRMMTRRGDPQERCTDRLAWRAARRAYVEAKLNLTAQQQPLWDKVQSAAQTEEQKERQLCASLKPGTEPTMLDRMDRMQRFLSARLEALQAARPAVQALYQALTPDQQVIFNRPFRR